MRKFEWLECDLLGRRFGLICSTNPWWCCSLGARASLLSPSLSKNTCIFRRFSGSCCCARVPAFARARSPRVSIMLMPSYTYAIARAIDQYCARSTSISRTCHFPNRVHFHCMPGSNGASKELFHYFIMMMPTRTSYMHMSCIDSSTFVFHFQ